MFKVLIFNSLLLALASCKPDHLVAPVVAPAVVTAQSSQYFVRNHNALYGPIIAEAPLLEPAAPILAAEPVIKANHLVAEPVFRRASIVAEQLVRAAPLLAEANPVLRTAHYVADTSLLVEPKPVLRTAPYVAEAPLVVEPKPVLRTAPLLAEPQPAPFVAEAPLVAEHLGAIFRNAPLVAETPVARPVFRTPFVAEQALLAERLVQAEPAGQPAKAEPAVKSDRLVQGFKSAPYRAEPASKLMNKVEAPVAPQTYQPSQPRPSSKKVNTEPLVETFGQQAAKPAGDNFERLQKTPADGAAVDAPFLTSSLYTQYYPGYSYYV